MFYFNCSLSGIHWAFVGVLRIEIFRVLTLHLTYHVPLLLLLIVLLCRVKHLIKVMNFVLYVTFRSSLDKLMILKNYVCVDIKLREVSLMQLLLRRSILIRKCRLLVLRALFVL